MEVVKTGMQHGDLSLDAYTQVTVQHPTNLDIHNRILTFGHCRCGRNVWHRCSSFPDSSDTQGNP